MPLLRLVWRPMRIHDRTLGRAFPAGVCAALLLLTAASCGASKSTSAPAATSAAEGAQGSAFVGAALPLEAPHDFTLADELGRSASPREYRGRVVLLAFLGTRCGAPCIVVAEQIRGALDQLSRTVPVLLVSVQPASDSRAAIARFLARVSLAGRARYLTGSLAALRAAWLPYRVRAPVSGGAAFERFAPVILLDRAGRARVEYALEQLTPEALAHDIRALER
jgi:protein SCO1/2